MPDISPLFAVEAEKLLSEGKTDDAIELCEKGILVYPKYPVALGILAKAYRIKGEMDAANEKLAAVEQFRPNYKAIEITKNQIEDPNFDILVTQSDSSPQTQTEYQKEDSPETQAELEISDDIDNITSAEEEYDNSQELETISEEIPTDELIGEDTSSEPDTDDNFDIDPEDIDALFADSEEDSSSAIVSDDNQELDSEEIPDQEETLEDIPEIVSDDIDISEIAYELYDENTPEEVELTSNLSDDLAAELDSLVEDIEEIDYASVETASPGPTNVESVSAENSDFDLTSELTELEDEDEPGDSNIELEIESSDDFDLSAELESLADDQDTTDLEPNTDDFNIASELSSLEHDEDLENVSSTIDDNADFEEYKDSEYFPEDIPESNHEPVENEVDLSGLPKNVKMSALLDNSVASIRARDLNLIPGLKTSPLQAESSVKTRNFSEQLLPASPAFPDSISVNAITSTLGNNWEARSIDIEENDIDRSGAEDNFSMLADKIKNLSMPKIDEPVTAEEEEDYAPPAVVSPTIANLLAMQGRTKEAIAAYKQLIIEDSDNADVYRQKIEKLE